jgi:hypothetical protein
MAYIVATTDPYGNPQCPVCWEPVAREGEFCTPGCWREFHEAIHEMGEPVIDINYLTLDQQPWYGKHHG